MCRKLEFINILDKGIHFLKDKDVRNAAEAFGNAMAQSGRNLEDEVNWMGERGLDLLINVRLSLFSSMWFYFSLHLGTEGNEQLNYLSQAQGLIAFDNLILRTVVARVFKSLQDEGKIPSRNIAILIVTINNGIQELEKLIKDSLKKFISIPESKEQTSEKQEEKKGDNQKRDNNENISTGD